MTRHEIEREEVTIEDGSARLSGSLGLPEAARGLVVFAHGSGSSRFSRRNRSVADVLNRGGLGTLLFDLLTAEEGRTDERTRHLRFDIPLLARRTTAAVDWARSDPDLQALRLGLFGASTGAAAALIAAAERPRGVGAVVSRGGRPDLAGDDLPRVEAPTLLIVGGLDAPVIDVNRAAERRLGGPHRLETVSGATHLFEEPGTLDEVAVLARDWFRSHLLGEGASEGRAAG